MQFPILQLCAYSVFNTFPVYPLSAKPLILLAFCRYRYHTSLFQRPSFQNMIKDIESGLINCVITKDLSRLGRNYLDCGLYLEVFFPEHNVRYIAVNDGVDTLNKSAMDITPFRNILNEMYAADISVKIKSAYRARFQQGKFMGTTAPYGYIKDPADHNHLLIDDKVAHILLY